MNIIIYNVNSFGGNYDYSKAIFRSYKEHKDVDKVLLLYPNNDTDDSTKDLLITDTPNINNKLLRKLHYLYRSISNPLRLAKFLKTQEPSVVIFNDFDQISSFFWYRKFLRQKDRHLFAVMLHDPDRDKFLPVTKLSVFTMEKVMSIMDIALSHGYLPDKPYYNNSIKKIEVPHGIYPAVELNKDLSEQIKSKRNKPYLLGVLGNIRDEKNYSFIIEALPQLPDCQLLVAGARSSGKVSTEVYKKKITDLQLDDRVIWIERFLDEDELNSAIEACDVILLYYKTSFTSQSGILNVIASYKKKLIITDTPSSLQQVSAAHGLGILVPPNDKQAFVDAVNKISLLDDSAFDAAWESYESSVSWHKHVEIAVDNFKKLVILS